MIIDSISNLSNYIVVNKNIKHLVNFLANQSLENLEVGKHVIHGNDCFVLIFEYLTKDPGEIVWERHKKYLDVHVAISGEEKVYFQNIDHGISLAEYDSEKDFEPFDATGQSLNLFGSTFFLFHPSDIHKASIISLEDPVKVRKAVFKLII